MTTSKPKPTFDLELAIIQRHGGPIIGVDEAGRGPLAGPVVAAAVAFSSKQIQCGLAAELAELNDSKVLTPDKRERLCNEILREFQAGIGIADRKRIDSDNILNATMWAMQKAVHHLNLRPTRVLVDGNKAPELHFPTETIVGGDKRCLSIAAASIIAKVTRDKMMCELGAVYPEYGFEKHKGYGTRSHLEAMRKHGICDAHRRSFRPVRTLLNLK